MNHPWNIKLDDLLQKCGLLQDDRDKLLENIVDDDVYTLAKKRIELLDEYNDCKGKIYDYDKYSIWEKSKMDVESEIYNSKKKLAKLEITLKNDQLQINNVNTELSESFIILDKLKKYHEDWNLDYKQLSTDIKNNTISINEWKTWDIIKVELNKKEYHDEQAVLRHNMNTFATKMTDFETKIEATRCKIKSLNSDLLYTLVAKTDKLGIKINSTNVLLEHSKKDACYLEEIKNGINVCKERLDHINSWSVYDENKVELNNIREADTLYTQIQNEEDNIKKLRKYYELKAVYDEYNTGLGVYDLYEQSLKINFKIEENTRLLCELNLKIQNIKEKLILKKENLKIILSLEEFYNRVHNVAVTMNSIMNKFVNFKEWILKQHIIPVICGNINTLLKIMCKNHRHLELQCVFDEKGGFNWLLKDGLQSPPIEKGSGFQKFVISLAMRIVLGRLGVSGIKNSQLFLDEAFISCDSGNLENVPFVLSELLSMYDSIVIVSHLEELKNNIRSFVNIERDDIKGVSQIRHGTMEVNYKNKKQKVGRPKMKNLF